VVEPVVVALVAANGPASCRTQARGCAMSHSPTGPPLDELVEVLAERLAEKAVEMVRRDLAARGPDDPSPRSPYVTPQDAADLLCTTRKRIYRLVHEGRLEGVKDGGRLLIVRASLDRHPRPAGPSAC
jgi:excisionase family DNA binding protein